MDNRPLTDAEKNEIAELAADKAYAGAMAAWYLMSQGGIPK